MKGLYLLFGDNSVFGPGTDLIISIVSILVVIIAFYKVKNDANIAKVREKQVEVVNQIAKNDSILGEKMTEFKSKHEITDNLMVEHKGFRQVFTFGKDVLFESGEEYLRDTGKLTIRIVGEIIKSRVEDLAEIQIHGHADIVPPSKYKRKYKNNVELAFARANVVFFYLKDTVGILPSENLMSVASYGEYKPVKRKVGDTDWDLKKIIEENKGDKKDDNRRIELLLIYR